MDIPKPSKIPGILLVTVCAGCLLLASLFAATPARAQDASRVEAARQLMEQGALSAAADSLRTHLRVEPGNVTAHWLLGRVLYWMGRGPDALAAYEAALALLPNEAPLRLEYAEVLLALGHRDRARKILESVRRAGTAPPGVEAEALALLGTLAYWEGDYSLAVRRFEAALARDPTHDDARTQLGEIRGLTRPWMRAAVDMLSDNQPYSRYRGTLEAGAYVTPLWTVSAGVVPRLLRAESDATALAARAGVAGYLPGLRLELEGSLGAWLALGDGSPTAWVGTAGAGLRLPGGLSLRAESSRQRYLATRASADTLLMVRTLDLRLDRAASPGWAGEAVVRLERFPDGNRVRTFYAWLLAPVRPWLRIGYSGAWQDADESRWVAAPGGTGADRYDPYFTPERIRVHAALGELVIPVGAAELRVNGNYGVHAREMAPAPGAEFFERGYSPWRLRAEAVLPLSPGVTARLAGERQRTSYYELDHLTLAVRYVFPGSTPGP